MTCLPTYNLAYWKKLKREPNIFRFFRDALVVAFTNCATSMFAGIVIFAIMGFKAHTVHSKCLDNRNQTLAEIFGQEGVPPDVLSELVTADATKGASNVVVDSGQSGNLTLSRSGLFLDGNS